MSADPDETLVDAEVPAELRRAFLVQAGLLNLAVLALGGGTVALAFTDRRRLGTVLLVVGVFGLALTWWRYRHTVDP